MRYVGMPVATSNPLRDEVDPWFPSFCRDLLNFVFEPTLKKRIVSFLRGRDGL
jgi:hypothetical protein